MLDFAAARHHMVESQLRTNKVTDEGLIAAMSELPRELFVPPALRGIAYVDEDVPLRDGRYLMEPMVLARLIQLAEIRPSDVVLNVGCANGYSTAVLARLCTTVVAVEEVPALAEEATKRLGELGVDNAVIVEGPLASGCPEQAPYDVILINGAVERIPDELAGQLGEGGRMVAVVERDGVGKGTLFRRQHGHLGRLEVFDAATPLLPGFEAAKGFVF